MKRIAFYFFYSLTWLLALIPLRGLFILSDITRFVIYHVFRYRRSVVSNNLRNSFPQKSQAELKHIEKEFYKHLCDMFVEVIYILHSSRDKAQKMVKFKNVDIIERYYQQGKSVIAILGHYCNWEVLNTVSLYTHHSIIAAYKPVKNKQFEAFLNNNRKRFGCIPICMADVARTAIKMNNNNEPFLLVLIADQSPTYSQTGYWTTFLNQDTPLFLGPEKIARKTNQPVLFSNVSKPRRGYYEVEFELLTDKPRETEPFEITEMHVRALEKLIVNVPQYWLWSHRRWKRKRPIA